MPSGGGAGQACWHSQAAPGAALPAREAWAGSGAPVATHREQSAAACSATARWGPLDAPDAPWRRRAHHPSCGPPARPQPQVHGVPRGRVGRPARRQRRRPRRFCRRRRPARPPVAAPPPRAAAPGRGAAAALARRAALELCAAHLCLPALERGAGGGDGAARRHARKAAGAAAAQRVHRRAHGMAQRARAPPPGELRTLWVLPLAAWTPPASMLTRVLYPLARIPLSVSFIALPLALSLAVKPAGLDGQGHTFTSPPGVSAKDGSTRCKAQHIMGPQQGLVAAGSARPAAG